MIKQIIKGLQANPAVTDWLINEVKTISDQAFYVLQKIETTRTVATCEYSVTVYHQYTDQGKAYLGSSSFAITHKISKSELAKKIDEAVFAASFIKNKAYDLVTGLKKQSWKEKTDIIEPFVMIDQIATTFFGESSSNIRFNSLEVFFTQTSSHIINSRGVDLKKTLNKFDVEAIPSFDGDKQNVELYKYFTYKTLDFDTIKADAINALKDVCSRYNAEPIKEINKVDVILSDKDAGEFFDNLISDFSFAGIYKQNTDKKIGDSVQKDVKGDLLTVGYTLSSKANAFDNDGVIVKPVKVIENGILVNYYGGNQYAQYLNMKPTGNMSTVSVPKGKTAIDKMRKKPHLEIVALSGIQIDIYSGYIGGEVRLALYYDGKDYHPVSGFSFSGSIDACLSNIVLSKEMTNRITYQGPKYIKLPTMELL
ncbi:MAG: metallopeptidase TldD-related protein [Candidatus Izemoplasmatales bacterium]|jgi:PmbA protein|nr:metallopeptidase TldD-related protein [Candidatus Izemoplasmatales bacterium]MDD3865860.1 metallopeptidase TldD-related protein [Candidatus Izemoplasmatales bacterium]